MSNSRLVRSVLVSLAIGAAVGAAAVTAGCSKDAGPVQVADSASGERIAELERRLREVENQNSTLRQAGNVAGLESKTAGEMISELGTRIKKLEDELAAAKAAAPAAAMGGDASGTTPPAPGATGPSLLTPPADGSSYTDEQITAFRKLSDEVERRKNLEAQAKRVRAELERAKITLTPQQEEAVVKLQAAYQDKMREIFSAGGFGGSDQDREARRTQLETLRTQFETDLRTIVPGADADRMVETMRRGFPGLFPRREGGRAMGGN